MSKQDFVKFALGLSSKEAAILVPGSALSSYYFCLEGSSLLIHNAVLFSHDLRYMWIFFYQLTRINRYFEMKPIFNIVGRQGTGLKFDRPYHTLSLSDIISFVENKIFLKLVYCPSSLCSSICLFFRRWESLKDTSTYGSAFRICSH